MPSANLRGGCGVLVFVQVGTQVGTLPVPVPAADAVDAEVLVHLALELDGPVQRLQRGLHFVRSRRVEHLEHVRSGQPAHRHAEQLRYPPPRWEHAPHGFFGLEVALDPRVPPLDVLQRELVDELVEAAVVIHEFSVREVTDELLADGRLEGVDDEARVGEPRHRGGVLLHRRGHPRAVEVLEHHPSQRLFHRRVPLLKIRNLRDVAVGGEMREELVDRLEEVGAVPVLPSHAQRLQLLHRGDQHAQPSQRGDGRRQVLLRKVQALDVSADLLHHVLALRRFALDVLDPSAELENGILGLI